MKKLLIITLLTMVSTFSATAQNSKAEQEILKIHHGMDQAFSKQDIAYFENLFAEDYVYSDPYGRMRNRAQNLDEMRKEWADAKYKLIGLTSDNPKVRISGNMALVTSDWTFSSAPADDPNGAPHTDKGRYTGVYEKRGGKWMLVAEHFSEAPHDRKLMEQEVLKAGQTAIEVLKRRDIATAERMLADEFLFTNGTGKVLNKAEVLADFKSDDEKIESGEISDQKVRVIGNNAAIETGTIKLKGSYKGKPYDVTEQYTTVWVWRGGRWQIIADHTSTIK